MAHVSHPDQYNKPVTVDNIRHSYSSLKEFEQCPYKFYRKRVVRDIPNVQTKAMRFGTIIHKYMEDVINGKRRRVPKFAAIQDVNPILDIVKKATLVLQDAQVLTELKMAFDKDWNHVAEAASGEFDVSKCGGVIGVADVVIVSPQGGTAYVIDWKTGNSRYPDDAQLNLMAMMVFIKYPAVEIVIGMLVFLKDYKVVVREHVRSNAIYQSNLWNGKIAKVENALVTGNFPTIKGVLCGWCEVTDCVHCGFNVK